MNEEEVLRQRKAIIAEALSWVGPPPWYRITTKYKHGELVKGYAASCASFIAAVWNNALGTHLTVIPYAEQWYLNAKKQLYLENLAEQGFVEISREQAHAADLVVSMPYTDIYSHGGIIVDWRLNPPGRPKPATVIHCSVQGVTRSPSMWSSWYFAQRTETHKYFRWGAWVDASA
jgi:hypothetical protein